MTWNVLEWPFYDKCSLLRTAFQHLIHLLYILFTHVVNGDVRKRTVIRRILGIREKNCGFFVDAASLEP